MKGEQQKKKLSRIQSKEWEREWARAPFEEGAEVSNDKAT